jgi:hypothetical protein
LCSPPSGPIKGQSRNSDSQSERPANLEPDSDLGSGAKLGPGFNRHLHTAVERSYPSMEYAELAAVSSHSVLTDSFGRFHDYLRISLTVSSKLQMPVPQLPRPRPRSSRLASAPSFLPGTVQPAVPVLHAGGRRVPHARGPPPHHRRGALSLSDACIRIFCSIDMKKEWQERENDQNWGKWVQSSFNSNSRCPRICSCTHFFSLSSSILSQGPAPRAPAAALVAAPPAATPPPSQLLPYESAHSTLHTGPQRPSGRGDRRTRAGRGLVA